MLFPYIRPEKTVSANASLKADSGKGIHLPPIAEKSLIGLSGINASFTMMNGLVSTFLVAFAAERGIGNVQMHFTVNAIVLLVTRIALAEKIK